jgi:hypothetical protein
MSKDLQHQLRDALAAAPMGAAGGWTIRLDHAAQHLVCELEAVDSLACAFTRLSVTGDRLAGATMDELATAAETLSRRLTYLLEPISPIEHDADRCVVQLRSNPPQKEGDRASYYELLVCRSGEVSLARYAKQPGGQRELVPAHVTREVLLRLAGDFAAVA